MNLERFRFKFFLNKKGQVTLFVILALLLVVAIAILFLVLRNSGGESGISDNSQDINPEGHLFNCMEEPLSEEVRRLGYQGGDLEGVPIINFQFEGEPGRNIPYLCYTSGIYSTCSVLEPLLINHLENELYNYINTEHLVEDCWRSMRRDYTNDGYEVNANYEDVEVDLLPGKMVVNFIDPSLEFNKGDDSVSIKELTLEFPTKIYDNAFVAIEIANQQSSYGSFNELGYMFFYPEFNIRWVPAQDESKIYTIKNEETLEVFRFAIRSLVPSESI